MSATSIPIRVIPGNTELVKDTSTPNGEYHLNVGFHISFNVKDLMQALVTMTDGDVTINASANVPMGKGGKGAQPEPVPVPKYGQPTERPPEKKPEDLLGGPLKSAAKDVNKEINWETPLGKLSPATAEYRNRTGTYYDRSSPGAKYVLKK